MNKTDHNSIGMGKILFFWAKEQVLFYLFYTLGIHEVLPLSSNFFFFMIIDMLHRSHDVYKCAW